MGRLRPARSTLIASVPITLVIVAAVAWAACTTAPASPSVSPPFSSSDPVVGTGAAAATGSSVTVDYTGWLYDPSKADQKGLQFDSSIGKTPFSTTLGSGAVIKGWDQGIPGMLVGGTRRLVIPPSLAYGGIRSGLIPPNSTLVFDITLLSMP